MSIFTALEFGSLSASAIGFLCHLGQTPLVHLDFVSTLWQLFPSELAVLKDKAFTFLKCWVFYESLQKALVSAGCSVVQHVAEN